MAQSRDFGRCPLASRLPTALWPIAGKPALELLLDHLADQNIKDVIIGSDGEYSLLKESLKDFNRLKVKFLKQSLPIGTAGAIREGSRNVNADLVIVLPANIANPPDIDKLVNEHYENKADLSVVFNPDNSNGKAFAQAVGIYVCSQAILKYIPKDGYFDIKEGLIPSLVQKGKDVRAMLLSSNAGVFNNRQEYLEAVAATLADTKKINRKFKLHKHNGTEPVWKDGDVDIHPQARIHGPVAVMDRAHISKDATIIGSTLIGRNVTIGQGALVTNSVLWDGAKIGSNCRINACVVDANVQVNSNTYVEEKAFAFESRGRVRRIVRKYQSRASNAVAQKQKHISEKTPIGVMFGLATGLIIAAFLWTYWQGLADLCLIWQRSDEYSSGLLVPFLAVYILWAKRDKIAQAPIKPCPWGILAFLFAQAVRLFGLFFMYGSAERLSIILTIAALVLMLFGWEIFKKVATVLLYLCFMLPWPNRVQAAIALPMQRWATSSAVFCLEMLGCAVVREGNIIHMGQSTVAVAEACNGLRMVMAFFVITGLVVLLVDRAWWEKLIVLISSLPVALLCNTIRLTVTALAFTVISGEKWEDIFHDFGGYAMMPLALLFVVAELWLITKLTTVSKDKTDQIVITRKAKVKG